MRSSKSVFALLIWSGCGGTGGAVHPDGGGTGDGPQFNFDFAGMVCSPSDPPQCDGSAVKVCRMDGSGYDFSPCASGCMNGACSCNPGDVQCMGQDVQQCGMDGAWHTTQTCMNGTQCINGMCADARCADETMSTNPHALPTNAWPRFRHDNRNTGSTPATVAAMPKLKWKAGPYGTHSLNGNLGGMASGVAVNQANVVFVGAGDGDGMNGALWGLDNTGKKLWVFAGNRGFGYTTPAVRADGTSYFSSADGNAYAVDPMGGLAWKFSFGFQDDSSPIVTSTGHVIYGSDTHELFAMDFNGALLWKSDPQTGPGEVDSALAETCDGKVIAGGSNGWTALDSNTGMTLWQVKANALMSSPMVTADGTVYGLDMSGIAIAIDSTGKVIWQQQVGPAGAGTSVAKVGNQLFMVTNDGNLKAIDSATGKLNWSKPVNNAAEIYKHGGPVVDGKQRLYVSSNDGNLYAFDTAGNQAWKLAVSGVAAPAMSNSFGETAIGFDGTLYIPGNDGNLYAFQ